MASRDDDLEFRTQASRPAHKLLAAQIRQAKIGD